jgi:uncharacterized protein YPO0396
VSDGFFEFDEDDGAAGFRLKRIELYNWGTFHNRIRVLPLEGKNGLLTGDIGSGKSTVVDAVTTLLVPANRVSYNKAAGADFKERSLRSYVMGYYKSERSDGGFSAKPVPLRKEGKTHSVILGVFHNRGYNQTVTLAQVFRQKDSTGQPDRFYVVSDSDMTIAEDFANFGKELGQLKKKLRGREQIEIFDTFPPYGSAFRRRFGLKNEQAMELFHQTVSLKTVGNLTSFVREHMLESFDAQSRIDNLIHHFEDLNKAHEAILRARKQIEELTPLVANLNAHGDSEREINQLVECRESLKFYFARRKINLLDTRLEQEELKAQKISLKRDQVKNRLTEFRADRDSLKQAIAANGGDHLESLKAESHRLEEEKATKMRRAGEYDELVKALGFPLLKTSEEFADNKKRLHDLAEESAQTKGELTNTLMEANFEFTRLKEEHRGLEEEIRSLKSRKSNIDSRQIAIRDRLCHDLHLSEDDLPFAGELMAVKEEEKSWEGALERVLHSFALSLLVPESLYSRVVEWVDETRLKGRLVYYRVGDFKKAPLQNYHDNSLMNKISIKQESTHYEWLRDQLIKRFDFTCCETLEEFRRAGKGLTRAGQIKGSPLRHEKDDRHDLNDRSRFVLGWTNRAKIAALEAQREALEAVLGEKGGVIARIQGEIASLEEKMTLLSKLQGYSHFEDLDWQPLSIKIDRITEEILILKKESDTLRALQEKLTLLEGEIGETEISLDNLKADLARIEEKREQAGELRSAEEEILKSAHRPEDEIFNLIEPLMVEFLGERKLYYESCNRAEQEYREILQGKINSQRKRLERLLQNIVGIMQNFRRDYPSETRDMDASLESGEEFRVFLNRLERDNLPRFETQFKALLNENTIREIAGFQAQLNTECQKIRERVELINRSMSAIEYNKDRYIYLEAMNTNDTEIRDFRQELKACIEGSFTGSGDQYTEAKFLQVKEIVNRFKGREGRSDSDKKWTAKVTDVRNWFAFAASERWLEDDTEYEHYTDSGGKSGGQKEKLAYTVLAASLAYQFGLEWGEVRSRSFRFVVIDEAFGRGSDESAQYGLELFKKLNLQLLIITPLQKIHIIEPYVSTVGFVHNEEGKDSLLRCLTIEQYRKEKEKRDI